MKYKLYISTLGIILISSLCFAQQKEPFYEQLVFDFYKTQILKAYPVDKRINICGYVAELHSIFNIPQCSENIYFGRDKNFEELQPYITEQLSIDSQHFEIDLSQVDKQQFRIKKMYGNKLPKLQITSPHIINEKGDRVYVNIYEEHKDKFVTYHLELNKQGEILNWCRTVALKMIVY
ncbi:MAG: hypothetical protein CMO01_21655 [Thalassobius sp.]|nr:hypothetical protein [Thalassovita sp.]